MKDIALSTSPITLKQMILMQKLAINSGDYMSLYELILERTNLDEDEALELDCDDIAKVSQLVFENIGQAAKLAQLGLTMPDVQL